MLNKIVSLRMKVYSNTYIYIYIHIWKSTWGFTQNDSPTPPLPFHYSNYGLFLFNAHLILNNKINRMEFKFRFESSHFIMTDGFISLKNHVILGNIKLNYDALLSNSYNQSISFLKDVEIKYEKGSIK